MKHVRTPDDRFENLTNWPYQPRYIDDLEGYEGLRMHYVDEGPTDASEVFLCLHGEPSWSYLYRKMIPAFLESGARVIAPDHFGFGRSDKPVADETYTWSFHRNALFALIKRLDLTSITLVCQDWGGILGLTLPVDMPDRFTRLLVMNTAIAIGVSPGDGFKAWQAHAAANPDLDVGALMKRASPILSDAEIAAYSAPFPSIDYKAGVRRFPQMVMTEPDMEGVDDSKRALAFWQKDWAGKSFMAVGMQDPVVGPKAMAWLRQQIKGCPDPLLIEEGGHFVQEWGEQIAKAALASFAQQ